MRRNQYILSSYLALAVLALIGLAGCGKHSAADRGNHAEHAHQGTPPSPDAIAHYTCAMHPSVRAAEPGKCPICSMPLTPVTHGELESGTVILDSERRQFVGVKTEIASKGPLVRKLRIAGNVRVDETRLVEVSLKYAGWIVELYADHEHKVVTEGEPLFTIYSPELYSAQQDLLEAAAFAQRDHERGARVFRAARERLELWDLHPHQIEKVLERGSPARSVAVLSPATGVVMNKSVAAGSPVRASTVLFRIADLSAVWIDAAVHESDMTHLKTGIQAGVQVPGEGADAIEGTVGWISPMLDRDTRTAPVRIELDNRRGRLMPGMYVDVEIALDLGDRLTIPREAVIFAGKRRIVFLDLGEGRLRPQQVKIGVSGDDHVEIVDGINEGDVVVSSGNFLIASESRLKSAVENW